MVIFFIFDVLLLLLLVVESGLEVTGPPFHSIHKICIYVGSLLSREQNEKFL